MTSLQRVTAAIPVAAAIDEIAAHPNLWLRDTTRQQMSRPHEQTMSIALRRRIVAPHQPFEDALDTCPDIAWGTLAATSALATTLAVHHRKALGRVTLVALAPQAAVLPHRDVGRYYDAHDRYHIVLQTNACKLTAAKSTAEPGVGDCWRVDTHEIHSARNYSADWRIHLIVDLARATAPHDVNIDGYVRAAAPPARENHRS